MTTDTAPVSLDESDYVRTQPFPTDQCPTEARMPSGGLYQRCTLPRGHDGECPPVQRLRAELTDAEFPIYAVVERFHEAETYDHHVDAIAAAVEIVGLAKTMQRKAVAAALNGGLSVTQVAAALGTTRQSVHTTYRREVAEAAANTCAGRVVGHTWNDAGTCIVCGENPFGGLPT